MKINKTIFNDVHIFSPNIFRDDRGFFFESYNTIDFNKLLDQTYLLCKIIILLQKNML